MHKYIFLSPHLDDAVLSCGGVIWDMVRRRQSVEIWTIFAGDPPSEDYSPFAREIHQRWQTGAEAPEARRAEDSLACERLNVPYVHFPYPDCIYRTFPDTQLPVIEKNEDLFQYPLPSGEIPLIAEITDHLKKVLPEGCELVLPLGIGNHIDHQIVRRAGEALERPTLYYADFPYAASHAGEIAAALPKNATQGRFPLSNLALATWQYAVEAYTSQISTFWTSLSEMYNKIEEYARSSIGNSLWQVENTGNLGNIP